MRYLSSGTHRRVIRQLEASIRGGSGEVPAIEHERDSIGLRVSETERPRVGWEGAVEMWGLYNEARVPGCEIGGPALFPSRFVLGRWMPSD